MTSLISAVLMTALAIMVGPATWAQGTPDDETPPNEGVCDELQGGTPGLYGLCVGFCEAQDCEATLDEVTDEVTFGENCKASAPRLLANYEKRAQAGDPPMPCVNTVAGECPCWTEAELDGLATTSQTCGETATLTAFKAKADGICLGEVDFVSVSDGNTCQLVANVAGEKSCETTSRMLKVTPDEYMICRNSIRNECDERGLPY